MINLWRSSLDQYIFMKYLPVLFLILIISCVRPDEAPVFRKVSNIRVSKVSGKEALLKGNALFYNPNNAKATLRKVNIDVWLEGKKIGVINQSAKTKIGALSDFTVPVDATFDIADIGILKSVLNVLGGKKMKVRYKGNIKLTYHGLPIRVPVDYEDDIRLR